MNKQELEKDNQALRKEVAHLIDTNQMLQTRVQELSEELYNTQIMELQKRRELDTASIMLAEAKKKEGASNSQSSPSLSGFSSPSQE